MFTAIHHRSHHNTLFVTTLAMGAAASTVNVDELKKSLDAASPDELKAALAAMPADAKAKVKAALGGDPPKITYFPLAG